MLLRVLGAAGLAVTLWSAQGCGSSKASNPKPSDRVPEMRMQIYDGIGGGIAAVSKSSKSCNNPSDPDCVLPVGNLSDAVTNATCPCGAECLRTAFDHNKNRNPAGTIQMYTPPASRRYFPGVPSAKHWENGVLTNIFTFDIQLTNFYPRALTNVSIVLTDISPDDGRQGFEDGRPHLCLNNRWAIWNFGDIGPGETVTRTVKLWLPNPDPFTITGYVVSLYGAECTANLQDSDGDGLDNASEIAAGTDPNDADTDGDGLFDGAETKTGVYAGWWDTGTDPLLRDTDGDCFGDGTEVAESTDPFDPADHPDRKCSHADLVNPVP